MELCGVCNNITFYPVSDDTYEHFQAHLFPSLGSLQASAANRTCRFCVLLDGLVRHQQWSPRGGLRVVRNPDQVNLSLAYPEDDLVALDLDGDEEDFPGHISVHHPLGDGAIQIASPEVLSRSRWEEETEEVNGQNNKNDISGVPLKENASTGSDAALQLAARWVDECRQNHASCRRSTMQKVKIPTRLVEVSRANGFDGRVFVISSSKARLGGDASRDARYATLSHRWIPNNPHTLTTDNLEELTTQGLRVGDLSKTFAESCMTTRKLGLRYIWIDSLCILQNSGDDMRVEIPLMGDYYENAELNIAASAEDIGGLWRDREGLATAPMCIPITLELPGGKGTRRHVLQVAPILEQSRSHLDARGWILQERLFPLRTIFFDSYWISFDCAEIVASESCPQGVLKGTFTQEDSKRVMREFSSLRRDFSISVTGGAIRRLTDDNAETKRQMYRFWHLVVEDFTRRTLTFESDRLAAISALAERMSRIVKDEYVAGIWKRDMTPGLEWYSRLAAPMWHGITRASGGHAPSWSWASLEAKPHADDPKDAEGSIMALPGINNDQDYITASQPEVDILDVSWKPADPGVLFGAVLNAAITLRGRPIRARFFSPYRNMSHLLAITAEEVLDEVSEESVATQKGHHQNPQTLEQPRHGRKLRNWEGWWIYASGEDVSGRRGRMVSLGDYPDVGSPKEEFVHLLPLRRTLNSGNWELFCLVLQPLGDGVTYRRIGAARFGVASLIKAKERTVSLV